MPNASRFLGGAALLLALSPLAFAQGVVSNAADLAPTGAGQASEYMPLPVPLPENDECHNNGAIFNSPGTHAGGGDESILQGDENLFGWGAQGGATNNRMADDFVVSSGDCDDLKGGVFHAYQTNATAATITAANVSVLTDNAGSPGSPVGDADCAGTFTATTTLSNVYRVTAAGGDSARRLQRVEFAFGGDGCQLSSGTYWLAVSYEGSASFSGPWQPPIPRPLGSTTCPGPSIGSGAHQSIAGAPFAPAFTDGISCQSDMPFSLLGQSAPGCDLKFLAADITYTPATRRLCMTVTVRNNGGAPHTARLELDYNRAGGPPSGTRTLGSGTLPGGAQATRTICLTVPGAAPDGNYNFDLRLVDADTGGDCDSYQETVSITAPRVGDAAVSGELFSVERVADLSPSASAVGSGSTVSPNPFARQTTISYEVAASADVRLAVYDVLGREVAVVVDGHQEAGAHTATFDARGLAAGTYVYRLVVGNDVQTGRLTLAY